MEVDSLEAVYYPRSYMADRRSLASYCLFFGKVHLIHTADISFAGSTADPTTYLKNLPGKVSISTLGSGGVDYASELAQHFKFALDHQELIGEVLFYHQHVIASDIERLTSGLLGGGLPMDELVALFTGQSEEGRAFENLRRTWPDLTNEMTHRVVATALYLSRKRGWCLVGDDPTMPVPLLSKRQATVRQLTSVIADECIRVALPKFMELRSEEIFEAREVLSDRLMPFRMAMQRLTLQLRASLEDERPLGDVWQEARFIAESQVQPSLFELVQNVERRRDKLAVKLFGKVVGWIPFVAKAFALPSATTTYNALDRIYGDIGDMTEAGLEYAGERESGLSYLLGVHQQFTRAS